MPKLIVGFLLGVVSTLAVVLLLEHSPSDSSEDLAGESSITEDLANPQISNPVSRPNQDREQGSKERPGSVSDATDSHTNSLPPDHDPVLAAQHTEQPSARAQDAAAQSSADKDFTSQENRSDYPPEIEEMIEHHVNKELQARYESDAREESWAIFMEGLLQEYFTQKPLLAQFYFSRFDCRTSVCAVHVIGYGPEALTQWNTATADIVSQPWFDFNNMSMNRNNPAPDILAIVLILTKDRQD